jgi:hypothetical protein
MKTERKFSTQLGAGLGLIEETRTLLSLWRPGIKTTEFFQAALESGYFSSVTARRLRNIVSECFAPRYITANEYPVSILKKIGAGLSTRELTQIFLLFTARANPILDEFIKSVYWMKYSSGHEYISGDDARAFVIHGIQAGKTVKAWSESTIKKVSSYLTGCCADFGLLERARRGESKIKAFRIEQKTAAYLAYDLHFAGCGDNAVICHSDWELFGLQAGDVREELKRLALSGYFIFQSAGGVTHIGWNYKNWEEISDVIVKG